MAWTTAPSIDRAERVRVLGIEVRARVPTGECQVVGDRLAGIAVHIAARVCDLAEPGEVLTSGTVHDLVAGSGIRFEDRGTHTLRGGPVLEMSLDPEQRDN